MSEIERPDAVGAHRRAETIREGIVGFARAKEAIAEAYEHRDWITLGYTSWEQYCEKEFSARRLKLNRSERGEAIEAFRELGMSVREIGAALDLPKSTVQDALKPPPPRPDPDTTQTTGSSEGVRGPGAQNPEGPGDPAPVAAAPGPSAQTATGMLGQHELPVDGAEAETTPADDTPAPAPLPGVMREGPGVTPDPPAADVDASPVDMQQPGLDSPAPASTGVPLLLFDA